MLRTRIIPCLLLYNGSLVKTVKFKSINYIGDPINAVRIFNEKEVDELIILDIGITSQKGEIDFKLIKRIASECFMPIVYGGGIRKIEHIRYLFEIGVEKVAINSYSFENPQFMKEATKLFGSQSIIASIDVKRNIIGKYEVYTNGGKNPTKKYPREYAKKMEEMGAGEILLNSIDRDGTWKGYDIKLIKDVTDITKIPVIACGGAGKIYDFTNAVIEGNASAVAVGSMVVYQAKDLGVLINFPNWESINKLFL